jgi:hypothetical protein
MSIRIQVRDPALARMLLLEAMRHGFRESEGPDILFIDLDAYPPLPLRDGITVGLSADPSSLSDEIRSGKIPVLSLPFSVSELEEILYRLQDMRERPLVERWNGRVLLRGEEVPLSDTERRLFDLLYDNRSRMVSDAELNAVLGDSASHTNTLSVYLYRLRRKLCADGVVRIRRSRGKGCQWIEK